MDKKTTLLTLLTFLVSSVLFGQVKYYKDNNGKIIDSLGYAKMKSDQIEKFKAISPTVVIKDQFKEVYKSKDSVIYSYKWDIKVGEAKEVEVNGFDPDKYIDKEFPFPNLNTLENKTISINKLKGKPTLINFWFTTCKPCIEEMPILNRIKALFKDSVNFIAVNYEASKKVRQFLKIHKYNFVQIADAKKFTDTLEMTSFPVSIFLDKNGKVIRIENGIPYILDKTKKMRMGDGKDFEKTLRKLL